MTDIPAQPGKFSATLVLEDDVRLGGVLSMLLDGRLQLESVAILDDPEGDDPVNVTTGSSAVLAITGDQPDAPDTANVTISGLSGDCIALAFDLADQPLALRYREAIARGPVEVEPESQLPEEPEDEPQELTNLLSESLDDLNLGQRGPKPVSDEYAELLARLEFEALDELERALHPFFADLNGYLQDLSSRLHQHMGDRNWHFEAAVAIRRKGDTIVSRIIKQLQSYFQDLTPRISDDQLWQFDRHRGSVEDLDLVGTREFEDYLAIDRMVTAGQEQHRLSLEALTVRTAELIGADPNRLRLPIHVRQLSRAFQQALRPEDIAPNVQTQIFDYFAERFIRQLDGYYEPLNEMLAEGDVRPRVEAEIRMKGSLLEQPEDDSRRPSARRLRAIKSEHDAPGDGEIEVARPMGRTQAPEAQRVQTLPGSRQSPVAAGDGTSGPADRAQVHQNLGEQIAEVVGHSDPQKLYQSVIEALNFRRQAQGLAMSGAAALAPDVPVSGTWDGATVPSADLDQARLADAQSIARALSALQHNNEARQAVHEIDSLREYLAANREQLEDLQDTSGLTAESLNQLDMVDNLFGTIRSQADVSTALKPALGNLQIPMAKIALLDQKFFADQSHSARAVIDRLSSLATSANFPNRALEGRIGEIVEGIISEYEADTAVFDSALKKIDRLAAQQERAQSRNVERVIRTMEGQEKLAAARREVEELISTHLKPPAAPRLLLDLMDNGWRDLLVLLNLKEGTESISWSEQADALEKLSGWLADMQRGLDEPGDAVARRVEAEPVLDMIKEQIASVMPTNFGHEEILDRLRSTLGGEGEIETAPVADDKDSGEQDAASVRARIEDLPRLRRWIKRVEQLSPGVWLTYRDRKNQKKRMQLAWISPDRDRFIFVNERGQRVADLSAIRLARQLSRGVQPPAPADRLSVVDKSMFTTLENVQKTLSFERNHDSLTRLINRDTFLNQMRRALRHSQQKGSQHAVLYINIDQFNLVNDVYDRVTGDQVLLEFARLLAQLNGRKASSARIEGDEFAVLLLDRPMQVATRVAEKIRADIEAASIDIEGENVSFTVSIGITAILEHSPGVESLLGAAAGAMRRAKQLGRNRVVQFQASDEEKNANDYQNQREQTREDLKEALETDRFVLRAQPIVQSAVEGGDSTLHYELLLGLRNKDGTLDSPEEFIESAERYGFMTLVDRWVIREAFRWISQLMDELKVVPNLAINLSGASVVDDNFMDYLLEQISEFGVGTSRLCFEITETGTISNLVKAADFVRAFRNIGCKFSIDDFGTGLASHNYLRELPVDYVKIDGSFIKGLESNRQDYAMARSINDLAHFLGQKTIAESVENESTIKLLKEIGVDYLQGFGVGKPKVLAEVTRELPKLEQ